MSEDQSVMRTTLLGSLLDSLRRNTSRGFDDVRLFEYGAVYLPRTATVPAPRRWDTGNPWYPVGDPELPVERARLAALMTGRVRPPSWGDAEPPRADFFAAKGVLEALMRALRVDCSVEPGSDRPFLHPRRGATVIVGETPAGWLGELHPSVAAEWDLDGVAGFELDFGVLASAATAVPRYEDLTSFPAIRQDLAVVVADDVPAARVLEVIRSAGGALLLGAEVFDVYRGAQVGEGLRLARDPARVPRRRPHADRRGGRAAAREDRRRAARSGRRGAAWLGSRCSAPAATPARSRRCSCTAIRSSSSRT